MRRSKDKKAGLISALLFTSLFILNGSSLGVPDKGVIEHEIYDENILKVSTEYKEDKEGYDVLSKDYREQEEFKRLDNIRKEEILLMNKEENKLTKEQDKLTKEQLAEEINSGTLEIEEEREVEIGSLGYNSKEVHESDVEDKVQEPKNAPASKLANNEVISQPEEKKEEKQGNGTIRINGKTFNVGRYFDETQVDSLQGYLDGGNIGVQWGYFTVNNGRGTHVSGHAPGIFGSISGAVGVGSVISVVDWDGNHKNYTVKQVVTMSHDIQGIPSDVQDIYNKVVSRDSFVLQFCLNSVNQLYYAE